MAKKIHRRLEQARAASHLGLLRHAPGKWHELTEAERIGQFAVHLVEPHRLVFIPMGDSDTYIIGNQYVWEKIQSIRIIEIIDYH